jgi:prophage maintenance system killer protein
MSLFLLVIVLSRNAAPSFASGPPISDGNKRIGSFLFLVFLQENNLLEQSGINDNGLVALALLIAESDPKQKDLMIRLIMNLLTPNN